MKASGRNLLSSDVTSLPSSWFFYTVAAVLGLSFSTILLLLAWNSSLENAQRTFAYELLSFDETARAQARAADSTLHALNRQLRAVVIAGADTSFDAVCATTLREQPYLVGIAWYARVSGQEALARRGACATESGTSFPDELDARQGGVQAADLRAVLETDAGMTLSFDEGVLAPSEYAIARRVHQGERTANGLLIVIVDAARLSGVRPSEDMFPFELVLESEGVGGRRTLLRSAEFDRDDGYVDTLRQSTRIRFDRYTLRLDARRALGWRDIDHGLLVTALILGVGVTLLLVALARAKELQARELSARNRVIEEQVRRQTYELALARDDALTASKVKSDFLASMSHEIRTPLNAIIGMAELLGDTSLSSEQARYVGVFKNAGEALLSLVNDILDLSKIEAGQLVLEQIEFEPRDLFEQAADIYALKTSAKGLELAVNVAPDVPLCLVGDPARIRQIVLNLLGNAVKFTERGEIVLTAEMLPASDTNLVLRCSVQDTGIGIPSDKLEAIFGNFTQVDSSTTRKYGGTGLGLAICRRLVEMMGGRIWVDSDVGEGSRFTFDVLLRRGSPQGITPVPVPDVGGRTVLVVDDNATNRLILSQTLGAAGARIVEAASGREAIRLADQPRHAGGGIDLVLCDSQMPEMDGFATVAALLARGVNSGRVLMLTSADLGHDVERARALGLGGYLVKPLKRRDLYSALAEVLKRSNVDASVQTAPPPDVEAPRRRVLLVEDNEDNRLLVRAYLKDAPYDIDEAVNGAEAVVRCEEQRYDLVLMDIQMPVMDGHEATRMIRAREVANGCSPVPIIALTAHAVKEEVDRSLLAGCTAHMTKPIKKKILLDLLARQMEAGHGTPTVPTSATG
ncbi:MAG: response regulator [Gammaproteobacteria bacterium]